ncbi:Aromatic di-alanine and TPR containing protein [Ceratobasidium theobromae]|uniref:Aromatic di-alanine and TPR containing protein n=1 Tax=Ceratobasidium theobromae TaxID=1582974 RepID=A0A5N5QAH2_9AGAM|nr:Aromatic di-alanine and TPR containing protein [Ceratobasidium theobromae]
MPNRLNNLRGASRCRFEQQATGQAGDINEAIEYLTRAVSLTPEGDPDMAGRQNNLGNSHHRRFKQLGKLEDIDKAIKYGTYAVSFTPESDPDMPACLNNFGGAHQSRFEQVGEVDDIDKAIQYGTRAVSLTPDPTDHLNMPAQLGNLGSTHQFRFEQLSKLEDINKAIECGTRAISLTPEDHLDMPMRLGNLGNAHQSRFERLGELEDIDKAIEYATCAVSLTPKGHPILPMRLGNLGGVHHSRFERLRKLEDIDKAIECLTRAVSITPEGHPNKHTQLNNLGSAHQSRFERLGEVEDIDKAIGCEIRAVLLTPKGHPSMPMQLGNLGGAHRFRFERLGEVGDINKAIKCSLENAHQSRFERPGELEDIDKAIQYATHAVSFTPEDHPGMPVRLGKLGNAHRSRFERLGKPEDIKEAIKCATHALSLTPKGHPNMPMRLNNLGNSHYSRFEQLGKLEDIEKAIECGTHTVSLMPEDHPEMSTQMNNLRHAHKSCFLSTGSLQSLTQSFHCYRNASQLSTGRPLFRFHAAREWAKLASLYANSDLVLAHQTAMALVPEVVWLGGAIGKRYEDTQTVTQAVLEAAAAAINEKEYALALEWLEQGRLIVWNQLLQLRNPVGDLSIDHPLLAANLQGLASQLHNAGSMLSSLSSSSYEPLSLEKAAQKHRQIAGQYETLLKQIRALPGFEGFLGPKRAPELLTTVKTGPVVVLNVHESRCDALIMLLGKSDIKHTPLPNLTAKKVANAHAQLQTTLKQHGLRDLSSSRRPDKSAMERWGRDKSAMKPQDDPFKQLLMILWSTVTKPILEFLGYSRPSTAEPLPHITWCAAGALSLLPLHAAGNYNQPGENLFSYAVSSFTPTISALVPSALPSFSPHSQLLAIGQEATPGQKQLPGTREELVAIKDCAQPPLGCMCIEGAGVTRKTVLEEIERHNWVHLACHAHQDVDDPTESGFFLHDGMLSLATITQKSFKGKGLAFLSACQTATGDRKIADEAVHLASGMLMAGYPSVIGIMWSVKDSDAPIIAREVYGKLLKDGKMNHKDAARALHEAVAKLRKWERGRSSDGRLLFISGFDDYIVIERVFRALYESGLTYTRFGL